MVKIIADAEDITHEEWLEIRKDYIGGSDAGAIAGVNPWSSKANVWLSKQPDAKPLEDNWRLRIGRDLEDYVARLFEEETGKKVQVDTNMYVSEEHPFMMANMDRVIPEENAVLECKTTGSYSKESWEDGKVPPHYFAQVQHYMAVCGFDKGYIAVLIGNEDFKWYEIKRSGAYIDTLIRLEKEFYEDNMLTGVLPRPDGSKAYTKALNDKYKGGDEEEIELEEMEIKLIQLDEVKKEIKALEKIKEEIEQDIKLAMGDHEKALVGERQVKWATYERTTFDRKALEKDYPEIAGKYFKRSKHRRFSVS